MESHPVFGQLFGPLPRLFLQTEILPMTDRTGPCPLRLQEKKSWSWIPKEDLGALETSQGDAEASFTGDTTKREINSKRNIQIQNSKTIGNAASLTFNGRLSRAYLPDFRETSIPEGPSLPDARSRHNRGRAVWPALTCVFLNLAAHMVCESL